MSVVVPVRSCLANPSYGADFFMHERGDMSEEKNQLFAMAMRQIIDRMEEDEYAAERLALHQYIDSKKAWVIDITVNAYSTFNNEQALACVFRWSDWLNAHVTMQEPAKSVGMWMQERRVEAQLHGVRVCVRTRIPVSVKVEIVETGILT